VYINLDKITSFTCNENRYPQFCKNYMEGLQKGIFLLISLCERS